VGKDPEPAKLNGTAAEMAHVGVHGLGASERQKSGAEHREGDAGP
jgi:hypothetical protein